MSAWSSGGLLLNDSSGCFSVPCTRTNVSTPEMIRLARMSIDRIELVGAVEADAPVAQDLEAPALEVVAAAHGVDIADARSSSPPAALRS